MKIGKLVLVGVLLPGAVIQEARAVVKDNPYQSIIDRNAFNLNPPPPPETNAPPAPPNKILLTGISSMGDKPKVFLEITEPGPGKTAQKPILTVGEKLYGVEVLSIDAEKGEVRVKNGPVETTLNFDKDGKTNAPTAIVNSPIVTPASPFATVPTRTMSTTPTTPTRPGMPTPVPGGSAPAPSPYGVPPAPGASGTSTDGLRTIPTRTLRLDQAKPQSYEESVLKVATTTELTADMVRRGELPPFPPTSLTPNPPSVGGVNGGGPPQFPTNIIPRFRR